MRTSRRRQASCAINRRRGITLTELLVASTVLTLIAGSMGTLALTVQTASDHCQAQNTAAQHARVASSRIRASVEAATASESFPGCAVFSETIGSYTFPDTLVIWLPTSTAADPQGLPRVRELIVYCPDPTTPNLLLEIRKPSDFSVVPALTDASAWQTLLTGFKTGGSAERTELSKLVRVGDGTNTGTPNLRGCVRFNLLMAPTSTQWTAYRTGSVAWGDLAWPMDLCGSQTGLRKVACQWEIQFDGSSVTSNHAAQPPVPCFGSATVSYLLSR